MTRYRAAPDGACLSTEVGLMTALYHRRSGMTHLVGEPVPQILAALTRTGPANAAAVAERLSEDFDLGPDAEARIAERLEELASLGLVTRTA